MIFGLLAAAVVLFSWVYGYWSNGMYGTRFEINSCWQGISACGVGLIGLFKWLVDSTKNSPSGEYPSGHHRPKDSTSQSPKEGKGGTLNIRRVIS